ncbi:NACHT domain-containing protein [Micromonospora sp. DR5-3]|uniref:NACHT domain-containing protein n=1 Tax=unclassified Micromonospora TaxID=2617518 RepID=UPI0011D2ED2B|nr:MULTISPECIES: NACHT domain-containing protein [unclassified Micromonospora]MCW3816956.1 NACHT domain-containing protein [Micromonospora sp. DR5-3]TYC23449.1 NACHT domain-containing protein [Micromonospora sp. MP36]
MRRGVWKWSLVTVVTLLGAGGTAWVWLRYDFEKVNWLWGVVAGVIAVYVVVDQLFADREVAPPTAWAHRRAAADELAELIRREPTDQGLLRAIDEPYPLPVAWRTAPDRLLPSWRSIGRSAEAGPIDLAGRDGALWECYRAVPSGRLLVLGPPGSGKSIIALRLVREFAARRDPEVPVPVLLPVDSWDPGAEGFHDWLVDRITRRYPSLAAGHPRRAAVVRDLLVADLVVPVLDGLDELPDDRLSACLAELNELPTQRFVLTCRSAVYEKYLIQGERLRATAVVTLAPLTAAQVGRYLRDAAPLHQVTNWSTVADRLDADAELAAALSTPLLVALARTAFDQPGTDPRDLLPLAAERGRRSVEDEVLSRAVDAALRSRRGGQGLRRWEPDRSRDYLTQLASHLESLDTREFRWWQLAVALPRPFWVAFDGLRAALAAWIALSPVRDALGALAAVTGHAQVRDLLHGVAAQPAVLVLLAALAAALRSALRDDPQHGVPPVRPVFTGGLRALLEGLVGGLVGGALWGVLTWPLFVAIGPPPRLVPLLGTVPALAHWSVPTQCAVAVGAGWCVFTVVRSALRVDLSAPAAELSALSPAGTLRADRAATLAALPLTAARAVALWFAGLAALWLAGLSDFPQPVAQVYAGLGLGLGWWLYRRGGGAWFRFGVARFVLAARNQLPYPLLAFLDHVEAVGLLRRGAGAYRFRHGRLQARLAAGSVAGRRGSRLREEFAVELAGAGYWPEAFRMLAAVAGTRAANVGLDDDRTAVALRRAVLVGAAAGHWSELADLLAQLPAPPSPGDAAAPTPVVEQRRLLADLVGRDAPVRDLLAAADELAAREERSGRRDPATVELQAVLRYAAGDVAAAREACERLVASVRSADVDAQWSAPLAAGLLAGLVVTDGRPTEAVAICRYDLALADVLPAGTDLLPLVETWRWSVAVLRRVTDEAAETLRRIRLAAHAERERGNRPVLTRREFAEIGLQGCHRAIGHPMFGPLALGAAYRLVTVLQAPDIVALTLHRPAPMWHDA